MELSSGQQRLLFVVVVLGLAGLGVWLIGGRHHPATPPPAKPTPTAAPATSTPAAVGVGFAGGGVAGW